YVLDNVDIPATVNYLSVYSIIGFWDQNAVSNTLMYLDSADTNRWSILYWDLEGMLEPRRITPFEFRRHNSDGSWGDIYHVAGVYYQPDLRSMHMRRLRTLYDAFYAHDQLINKF